MESVFAGKTAEKKFATLIAMLLSVIHVLNIWVTLPSHMMRGIHLAFILTLIFLGSNFNREKPSQCTVNIIELVLGALGCGYYAFVYEELTMRMNSLTMADKIIGLILILIILDATRRTVGTGMAVVTVVDRKSVV